MSTNARLLQRPIYGGVFGDGRYALASMPAVSRGLYTTRYMVVQPQDGVVLSVADDKTEALAGARRLLRAASDLQANDADERQQVQGELWPGEPAPAAEDAPRYVSRRRRAIFERSEGRCHYCSTLLTLDGKWHVEHQLPRALGGGDDALNLVAACVRCNLEKSDRTALEYIARDSGMVL
jgi:hypothetical protein